jgi:hypothetical protein
MLDRIRIPAHSYWMKKAKPKRDLNQLAKRIVDIATGEEEAEEVTEESDEEADGKNPAAVALGRLESDRVSDRHR